MKHHKATRRIREQSAIEHGKFMNYAKNRYGHNNKKPEERPTIYYLTNIIREMNMDAKVKIAKRDSWARMRSNPKLYKWEQGRGNVINHDIEHNNPSIVSTVLKGKKFSGSGIMAIAELGEALIKEEVGQKILDTAKERIGGSNKGRDWRGRIK